ncbi:hypothetical protein GCM10010497_61770 [Streptomyces cinereoruber]|uniref:Uncharacterized protein n=1 Tax=Streptomyces cinereoruber TaxID=67260 RepID=A0AAV4KU42_9ACTN|nr:hypothetical protein GCM10010497_61770 [Streptomyces cinereoruber]
MVDDDDGEHDGTGRRHGEGQDEPFGHGFLRWDRWGGRDQRERERRIAVARTAGAMIISVVVRTDVPPFGWGRVTGR